MALRWGIASTGKICHDFTTALHVLPKENHQVVAVAARSLQDAQTFAKNHGIPNALEGYEALANHPDVDIVYIGAINTKHLEISKLMLDHGKHILCEKPLTMNASDSKCLLDYAKSKKLFAMEAVWSRSFPAYHELKNQLDSGAIGDVKHVSATFGYPLEHISRVNAKDLGGSTILDIGIYTVQIAQYVYRGLKPLKLVANGFTNQNGVDTFSNAIITYPGEKIATLTVSSQCELPNEAVITGTKGTIKLPTFWCPDTIVTPSGTKVFKLPDSPGRFNFGNSVGLNYEAEECRQCIKKGLLESPTIPHEESLELASLMDSWRKACNAFY